MDIGALVPNPASKMSYLAHVQRYAQIFNGGKWADRPEPEVRKFLVLSDMFIPTSVLTSPGLYASVVIISGQSIS